MFRILSHEAPCLSSDEHDDLSRPKLKQHDEERDSAIVPGDISTVKSITMDGITRSEVASSSRYRLKRGTKLSVSGDSH